MEKHDYRSAKRYLVTTWSRALDEMEVILTEDNGKTLVLENR